MLVLRRLTVRLLSSGTRVLRSRLGQLGQLRGGNYTNFNMYEINNACDGGPDIFDFLQTL
jgi:hypothetical protein